MIFSFGFQDPLIPVPNFPLWHKSNEFIDVAPYVYVIFIIGIHSKLRSDGFLIY